MATIRKDTEWIYSALRKAYEQESGREIESVSKIQLRPIVDNVSEDTKRAAIMLEPAYIEFEFDFSKRPQRLEALEWRKFQFVVTVQSALITDATTRAVKADETYSAPVRLMANMAEVFHAATILPADLDVREAAWRFAHWLIAAADNRDDMEQPAWYTSPPGW
jgi:hypothetical protein